MQAMRRCVKRFRPSDFPVGLIFFAQLGKALGRGVVEQQRKCGLGHENNLFRFGANLSISKRPGLRTDVKPIHNHSVYPGTIFEQRAPAHFQVIFVSPRPRAAR
jgi:hypothetical protein